MEKAIKDLVVGDIVVLIEPIGCAQLMHKSTSRLFQASGGCFRLDLKIIDGQFKGNWLRDQHHPGNMVVEVKEKH